MYEFLVQRGMEECGKVLLPNLVTLGAQATNCGHLSWHGTKEYPPSHFSFKTYNSDPSRRDSEGAFLVSATLRSDRGPALLKPRHWKAITENMGHLKEQHPVTLDVGWQREKNKSDIWTHVDTIRIHEFLGGG